MCGKMRWRHCITTFKWINIESVISEKTGFIHIKEISGNTITVNRGQDETEIVSHTSGTVVNIINNADDALIEQDDDFGFSEYRYDYGDGKIYSPTKGIDVWKIILIR